MYKFSEPCLHIRDVCKTNGASYLATSLLIDRIISEYSAMFSLGINGYVFLVSDRLSRAYLT